MYDSEDRFQPTFDKQGKPEREKNSVIRIQEVNVISVPVPIEIETSVSQISRPTVDTDLGTSSGAIVSKHLEAFIFGQDALERLSFLEFLSPLSIDLGKEFLNVGSSFRLKFLRCQAKFRVNKSVRVGSGSVRCRGPVPIPQRASVVIGGRERHSVCNLNDGTWDRWEVGR